jgi:hypothetical protein
MVKLSSGERSGLDIIPIGVLLVARQNRPPFFMEKRRIGIDFILKYDIVYSEDDKGISTRVVFFCGRTLIIKYPKSTH